MMYKRILAAFIIMTPFLGLGAQVQNVNIGGSFSGTFMMSGSGNAPSQVAGSPYLNEAWMFGSLELKKEIVRNNKNKSKKKSEIHKYEAEIAKIDALLSKLNDPNYEVGGLSILMKGDEGKDVEDYDLRISKKEFSGIEGISMDLKSKLVFHLEQLRGEYQAEISEFFKLEGLFRYNLYAQEFEMVYGKDTFSISAPFNVERVTISNMSFMHGLYVKRGIQPHLGSAYFQVLNDGECKLLKRHDVRIKSGSGPTTHSWAGSGDAFVHYETLYYQEGEGKEVVPVKNRKKLVKTLFPDQQEKIDRFIRAEKINLNNDVDLARVFRYYESLKS